MALKDKDHRITFRITTQILRRLQQANENSGCNIPLNSFLLVLLDESLSNREAKSAYRRE